MSTIDLSYGSSKLPNSPEDMVIGECVIYSPVDSPRKLSEDSPKALTRACQLTTLGPN